MLGRPSEDMIIGQGLLKKFELLHVFLHLGMCPNRDMRKALADHIETLTRDEFLQFAKMVLQCIKKHQFELPDGTTRGEPTGGELQNVSFSTRSHANMTANSLVDKLRGEKTDKEEGTSAGTPFQEEQDNGEWHKVVTKFPRFTRCIRPELVLFLRAGPFVGSPQLSRDSVLKRVITKFEGFYTAELFAVICSQWYACNVPLSLFDQFRWLSLLRTYCSNGRASYGADNTLPEE